MHYSSQLRKYNFCKDYNFYKNKNVKQLMLIIFVFLILVNKAGFIKLSNVDKGFFPIEINTDHIKCTLERIG